MIIKNTFSRINTNINSRKTKLDNNLEKYKIKYAAAVFYSVIFLLLGFSFFPTKIATGLLTCMIALIIFPPTETFLKKKYNINLTKDVKAPIILFLFFLVSLSLSSDTTNKNTTPPKTETTNESTQIESTQAVNSLVNEPKYKIIKVIDGDTVVASINGKDERVRLIGIDTPETTDPKKTVQCFGIEAKTKSTEELLNKEVYLIADETQADRDKYGRLLRYIFLPVNSEIALNFDEMLIRDGFAHEYTYDKAYKYQQEFREAEITAKNAGKGLWAPNACN